MELSVTYYGDYGGPSQWELVKYSTRLNKIYEERGAYDDKGKQIEANVKMVDDISNKKSYNWAKNRQPGCYTYEKNLQNVD